MHFFVIVTDIEGIISSHIIGERLNLIHVMKNHPLDEMLFYFVMF